MIAMIGTSDQPCAGWVKLVTMRVLLLPPLLPLVGEKLTGHVIGVIPVWCASEAGVCCVCRQITDSFRKSYALLWQSLIFADVEGIKQHSQAMNPGDMHPLFAGMLTNRPWDEVLPTHST